MKSLKTIILIIVMIIIFIILTIIGVLGGWFNTWFKNKVEYVDQKIEDRTSYKTKKEVEDSCRSMIASYKTDKATYDQYKDSENQEKQSWGEQAKMRANKTANTYNEYVLKNSFVWEGNIPEDIEQKLSLID